MTLTAGRQVLLATVTEAGWRRHVIAWAKAAGWRVTSMHDSRMQTWGTDRGFPDLLLLRPPRLVLAELKTTRGRLSQPQRDWIADLLRVPCVEVHCWRPTDELAVKAALA